MNLSDKAALDNIVDSAVADMAVIFDKLYALRNVHLSKIVQLVSAHKGAIKGEKSIANKVSVVSFSSISSRSLDPFTYMATSQIDAVIEISSKIYSSPASCLTNLESILNKGSYTDKGRSFVFHPDFVAAANNEINALIIIGKQKILMEEKLSDLSSNPILRSAAHV